MDGMTRASFRSICFDYGADGATTEMIQSLALGRAKKRMSETFAETLVRYPNERNLAAQLIGSNPAMMAESARRLTAMGRFDAIDINMGCPARKVVGSGNGSALLKTPERALEVMRAVRAATDLPVRLKLRLGWDDEHITAPFLVEQAERLGFESVTLHGRTREQMYLGPVDTPAIRAICDAVRIPVYANGGVTCAEDALDFLREDRRGGRGHRPRGAEAALDFRRHRHRLAGERRRPARPGARRPADPAGRAGLWPPPRERGHLRDAQASAAGCCGPHRL